MTLQQFLSSGSEVMTVDWDAPCLTPGEATADVYTRLRGPLFREREASTPTLTAEDVEVVVSTVLAKLAGVTTTSKTTSKTKIGKPKRHPNQPSPDRQNDIFAAIHASGTPLQREEITTAMGLKKEGKLGHNLAWMVAERLLVNVTGRGYWPAHLPVPK